MAQGAPFNSWTIRNGKRGDVWRVTLDKAANVFMVDSSGLSAFKSGRRFTHYGGGGLMRTSPHDFVIPRNGTWYIVAHSWGLKYPARVGVQHRPQARPMPDATPNIEDLNSIARAAAVYPGADQAPPVASAAKEYDVFISHASEDKDAIVRDLANALRAEGLKVWYDEFELRIGSSLRRSIDQGLANSRFGVVVLSNAFFGRGWPNYELDGLVTREVASGGQQLLLPIWHHITKDELISYSPSLADKVALRTADSTIAEIASEIAAVVQDV